MNLLTINPISSCNLSCEHCPNKEWTYPIDHEVNRVNNEIIFKWLEIYFNPYEWFLEISGGEPGLYPEINELIKTLNSIGYHGIIRTNGTLPTPKTDNFKRIAAWHKPISLFHPPEYCDMMFILENPDDCWKDKVEYCVNNNIPYKCFPYKRFGDPSFVDEPYRSDGKINTFFKHWTSVGSYGNLGYCYANWGKEHENMTDMSPPLLWNLDTCPTCSGIIGILELLDDALIDKLNEREKHFLLKKDI